MGGREQMKEWFLVTQILSLVLKQLQYLRSDLEHHQEQGNLLPSLSSYSEYVKHYRVKPNKLGINAPLWLTGMQLSTLPTLYKK